MTGLIDLWKTRVPRSWQGAVLDRRVAARARLDTRRPLPGLLVIGGQRCGTSSLYKYLEAHPCLLSSVRKETEYFSLEFERGDAWYRAHFATRLRHHRVRARHGAAVAFEASPHYLLHPRAPARAARAIPDAKLIALVRDPVERAWSHFRHEVRRGREHRSFEAAVDAEPPDVAADLEDLDRDPEAARRLVQTAYATKGRYAEQLERWLEHFPRQQLLVVRTEDLINETAAVYDQIIAFLGLPAWQPPDFANHSYVGEPPAAERVPAAIRERLAAEFAAHNDRLNQLFHRDFGWSPVPT